MPTATSLRRECSLLISCSEKRPPSARVLTPTVAAMATVALARGANVSALAPSSCSRRRCRRRVDARWTTPGRATVASSASADDRAGESSGEIRPKRATGGRVGRAASTPGGGAAGTSPARRVVRRKPTVDRGKARTDEEKAAAMRELKAKAIAPRIDALVAVVVDACGRDEYKRANVAYAELKNDCADGVIPAEVFTAMLELCARLRMPSSAEGIFVDSVAAGHAPTETICWKLVEIFEQAGEKTRAEKVLAYMETRGMS